MKTGSIGYVAFAVILSSVQVHAQWTSVGLSGKSIYSFTSIGNTIIVGTRSQGIFRSINLGQTWTKVSTGDLDLAYINALTTVGYTVIAGTNIGGKATYISTDSGASWSPVNSSISDIVMALPARQDTVFAGTFSSGIYRTTDKGNTWTHMGSGEFLNSFILSMLWKGNTLYAGTHSNWLGIWKSTDVGSTWETSNSGLPKDPISQTFRDIPCMTANERAIFAGTSWAGCYRSTDEGAHWDSVNTGLPVNAYVYSITSIGSTMYLGILGTGADVYQTTDDGDHWTSIGAGLPANDGILSLYINGAYLYAGIAHNGVWKYSMPVSDVGTNPADKIPTEFQLAQNYPNPFNPSTTIRFDLPKQSHVVLKIYDVLGREFVKLLDETKPAGSYNKTWNCSDVPGGIYFYRLQAGHFIETKKLLLIR